MTERRRRQVLIALGTGAIAAIAGCTESEDDADDGESPASDDDSATDDDPEGQDDDAGADDTAATGDDADADAETDPDDDGETGPDDTDGEFDRAVWEPLEFAFEARYEWEVFIDGEDGTLVWDVVNIEGDQITIETDWVLGDVEFTQTATGTQQELESELMATPAGAVLSWAAFSPMWGGFIGEEFSVGDGWSQTTPDGTVSYEVADFDTTTYPVDCYVVEMRQDDEPIHEGCISPDHGMAVYSAWYDEGVREVEIELVSFERH